MTGPPWTPVRGRKDGTNRIDRAASQSPDECPPVGSTGVQPSTPNTKQNKDRDSRSEEMEHWKIKRNNNAKTDGSSSSETSLFFFLFSVAFCCSSVLSLRLRSGLPTFCFPVRFFSSLLVSVPDWSRFRAMALGHLLLVFLVIVIVAPLSPFFRFFCRVLRENVLSLEFF